MKYSFAILILYTGTAYAQDKKVTSGNQQWVQYYNETRLSNKWTLMADGGFRWKDGFETSSQYIVRAGAGYTINPAIRVGAGFAHLGFYASGHINKVEFRPYQELSIKNKYHKLGISHRLRVEERFFNPVTNGAIQSSNTFNFRFRYSFMTNIPLFRLSKTNGGKVVSLSLGDEIFINAGKDIVYNVFDQNRFIISPTISFNKDLSLSLTWNNQFAANPAPSSYTYTNVIWLQVRHTLAINHKKN